MLILHAALSNQLDGVSFVWAETEESDRPRRKGKSRWRWLAGAREHSYQGSRDLLRVVFPEDVLQMGRWRWMTAWLPSDEAGPLPSERGVAPLADRQVEQLAPWGVRALVSSAVCLHELFLARREQAPTVWRFGLDGTFLERAHELAGSLVVRQQFLPGVIKGRRDCFADWQAVYEADDLKRMEQLARAMPLSVRALNTDADRPPADTPHWVLHSLINRLVGSMVKRAELEGEVWKTLPEGVGERGAITRHERWLAALLVVGTEIQGSGEELADLAVEIDTWRKPVFRLPKLESGDNAPAISLASGGEGFWESRDLPGPLECPEVPRTPAKILDHVGEFPNWRGERMLRDSLEPVYEAASRYALEYVFSQKPEPRHRS
jgi:hypothetical protein